MDFNLLVFLESLGVPSIVIFVVVLFLILRKQESSHHKYTLDLLTKERDRTAELQGQIDKKDSIISTLRKDRENLEDILRDQKHKTDLAEYKLEKLTKEIKNGS